MCVYVCSASHADLKGVWRHVDASGDDWLACVPSSEGVATCCRGVDSFGSAKQGIECGSRNVVDDVERGRLDLKRFGVGSCDLITVAFRPCGSGEVGEIDSRRSSYEKKAPSHLVRNQFSHH